MSDHGSGSGEDDFGSLVVGLVTILILAIVQVVHFLLTGELIHN